jgi:HK97 family phage portal protein
MPLFKKREKNTPAQERDVSVLNETAVDDVLLKSLLAGDSITREQALNIPAVASAVDLIAGSIASMPVRLFRLKEQSNIVEEIKNDSRIALLNGDTRDTLDGFQMKKALVSDYLMDGNGYVFIERNGNDVSGLHYVEDDLVAVSILNIGIWKTYKITCSGGTYEPFDFIKLLRNTRNGADGEGITDEIGKALETAYRSMIYQLTMTKTNGNKRGFLKSERRLGQDEINLLKRAWNNLYNSDNEENVVVLNNGLSFQEASSTAVEMQLNETVKSLSEQITDIFHIYPDSFELTFKLAIYPIVKALETALNRDLLLENEKGRKFFVFDVKEIIRANVKERYEAYKLAKECGFMTINEMRREENMNHIDGLDVVNVGLGAVLYNTETHEWYTPNTDSVKTQEEDAIIDGEEGML